ncbi:unnamed protein product [Moneuplotes crassus]|uniref:Uncharacterized protein n=1 Tax=Euplotes crassus TaxID=5936 RepID=A0AAD2DBZ3_EUPCR|nr:unnamed protein product [Moneuplotes crassus]
MMTTLFTPTIFLNLVRISKTSTNFVGQLYPITHFPVDTSLKRMTSSELGTESFKSRRSLKILKHLETYPIFM